MKKYGCMHGLTIYPRVLCDLSWASILHMIFIKWGIEYSVVRYKMDIGFLIPTISLVGT